MEKWREKSFRKMTGGRMRVQEEKETWLEEQADHSTEPGLKVELDEVTFRQ